MFEEKLLEISSDEDDEKDGMATSSSRSTIASISAAADSTQPICPPPPPPPILAPINFSNRPSINQQQEIQPTSSKTSSIERRPPIPLNRIEFGKRETPISFKTTRKHASTPIPTSNSMDLGKAEQDWLVEDEEEEPIFENEELERIMDSPYWTQSIAPGKFYKRTRDGGQIATPALCNLQQEFSQRVLGTIRTGQTAQPHSEPPNGQNSHQSCGNCSNHHHSHSEDENSSNGESSSIFSSSLSSISSICSSPSLESAEEEGELGNSAEEEEFDGKRKKRRKMGGGRRKRRGRERKSHQMKGEKRRHGNGLKSAANIVTRNEIERKRTHPAALHPDIGFNEPGQLNDGPLCKCSWAARQSGVRHGKYRGEQPIPRCDWKSSNIDRLHHYVLQLDPDPAQFSRQFTQIQMDGHSYKFDGFSVFFHQPLPEYFPQRPINQWNQQYQVRLLNENAPESFTVNDLELFHTFLFDQVLEFYDLDRNLNIQNAGGDCCLFYHCLPRFSRKLPDNGKELLPMSSVLAHFLSTFSPLIDDQLCRHFRSNPRALAEFARRNKGQICVNPTKRPMAIRMDLLDSGAEAGIGQRNFGVGQNDFPLITHFGIKPTAFAYMKKPEYQNALHKYFELRKKLAQKSVPISSEEKRELKKCRELVEILKKECKARRDSIMHLSSRNFYSTGLFPDIIQHSLFLVLACQHIRFHCSLDSLEKQQLGGYTFRNRSLLELALIHPSFRTNYGTNPDHAKNVLNNCGIRMSKLTKVKEKHKMKGMGGTNLEAPPPPTTPNLCQSGRRKGIRMLMEIMAMQGCPTPNNGGESPSLDEKVVRHNERLEFLGDTVVELLTTVHLFLLFTDLDEGGLATFRSALVQNRHLATLADRLGLQHYMVYAHGPDLCHEADLRHAMANTFEALMGAIYLDSGLAECDRIFGDALFKDDPKLLAIWNHLPEHPLKRDSPFGDRHLIDSIPCLKNLAQFEESIGIHFKHIRLLAKAFTRRNVPYNYLTLGHNQRLEFLGDTILQLLTTDYLYRHFPHHQEGHLSLLRTCLVSNRTQSVVCDDLAMANYLVVPQSIFRKCPQAQLRLKDKADLVESFLGALYIDRGLRYCRQFCQVCFFPRLKYFILNQSWNDPKSRLQQCCLTLRDPKTRGEPDIPKYKTIGIEGPTNTRVYRVAVYFRKKRLAIGCGASMHIAQMEAAKNALVENAHIFPSIFNQNEEDNGKEEEGNYENILNEERKKGSRKRKAIFPIH